MRGPQFMLGYWKSPDATDAVLRDGWYWSGDVVRVDETGQYYVVDRRKEMMKYKGFSIAPAEVESVLLEHPGVRDCGVVSRIEADGDETPCAFVVLREGELETEQSSDGMLAFMGERMASYKVPREIHFVAEHSTNAVGKDSAPGIAQAGSRSRLFAFGSLRFSALGAYRLAASQRLQDRSLAL